jgi:hypothetical protein
MRARRRVRSRPCDPRATRAAAAYAAAPDDPRAKAQFEQRARHDFTAGQVAVLDGWVVADTELALLAIVDPTIPRT